MAVQPDQSREARPEAPPSALEALALAALEAGSGAGGEGSLQPLALAAAAATSADAAIVRTVDPSGRWLVARAVWSASAALGAELEGSRFPVGELPAGEVADPAALPLQLARAAVRLGAGGTLLLPLVADGRTLGSLELLRRGAPFGREERSYARIAATQLALTLLALGAAEGAAGARLGAEEALKLAGEALAAGSDEASVAEQVARLAAEGSGAAASLVWLLDPEQDRPGLVAAYGDDVLVGDDDAARVTRALAGRRPAAFEPVPGGAVSSILPLGQPPLGALELRFEDGAEENADLTRFATFGARAAQALRASGRARRTELELDRNRALLEVVGQAFAELSLEHALETAVERVAELLAAERVAVYLRENGAVVAAEVRNLAGPHARLAELLLRLALRSQGGGVLVVEDVADDARLDGVRDAAAEAGIEAAAVVPLGVEDEVIGLLAVYPDRGRRLSSNELTLLRGLAGQLAVALQNARLHEQATQLGDELEHALAAERSSARTLRALYDVSASFAQSLRLDSTLDALAASAIALLGVDAAVIHTPDERGDVLEPSVLRTRNPTLDAALRALLARPVSSRLWPRPAARTPLLLDPASAAGMGEAGAVLVALLERGWSVAVVPVNAPSDPLSGPPALLATLTVLALGPDGAIDAETVDLAATIAGQAALAIDNARLYQQQKGFADRMQRSLLRSERPRLEGLEVGDVYASSARLEVGGDVYDYAMLADGRLAVVLGDVTGHGVEATDDMAMATWVFRALSREHPDPGDFLHHANEVVVGEVASGKFVTMIYLTIDPATGEIACAAAGHPSPRIVTAEGAVSALVARGLPLGIEEAQTYDEVRHTLAPGAAVVLFTDGVIEARQGRELYGEERLDALLAARARLDPTALAEEVLADCRRFGGDELSDDCAVVVIRRAGP